MRFVVILQFLFVVVNSCQEFWKHWEKFSCPSKEHCPNSKNSSYIQIFSGFLLISCDNETADSRLTQCLDVKSVKSITFVNCYLSGIDLGKFNFGYEIERVRIMYTPYFRRRNFHSASFSNMSSLKSVEIQQVWTSELFNLTFHNVSSLTSLTIKINNIHLFPNRPFRELTNLSELSITNGNLKVLPADLFYNLGNLTKLVLSNNKIESIHSHTFRNLTRLESLNLEMNGINYLHSETLKGLSNLRTFSIDQNNRLSVIPTGLFKGLRNLTTFRALLCSISELDDDVFFDLINLQYINLDANQIEYLPPNLLKNNKLLTKFSCMDNKISALPSGIFRGLSHLFHVNLMGNRLKNLPKDIFANLSSLDILLLSNNRLKLLPEDVFLPLTHLFHLDLSDNNLIKLSGKHPFGKSKDLDILRLYKAGLTEWPVVNWTEYNMTYIDFSDNHFETVKLPIYAANRMIIDLSDCKIRTIYIDEWKYGSEMPTFDLNKNKVTCDRKLRQFVFALKPNLNRTLKMFPDIKYIKCYGEKETVLEHISSVVPKEYCPTNCYCFAEKNEVTFNCSGKGINTIPQASIPNVTIVDLSNNYIKKLSKVDFAGWKNVTRLRLSNNSLSKFPDSVLPSRMKFLWLDGNRLTELPPALTNLIDASKEFKIYLSGNNWSCDCKTRFRRDWLLRNMHKIADFSKVSCKTTSRTLSFRKVVSGNYCGRTAKSVSGTKVSVIVLSVFIIIGLIILASIVYYKRRNITIEKSTSQEDGALSYNVYHQFWLILVKSFGNIGGMFLVNHGQTAAIDQITFPLLKYSINPYSSSAARKRLTLVLMRCLNVKNVQEITFTDCYMSGIDFGIFTFGFAIERINIFLYKRNFESASFNNMSSLRSVEIREVTTSELLNLTFRNVPSLTSLTILLYNFTLFPNKPFRELINLSELSITGGKLRDLPEDLFYNLGNLTKLDLTYNNVESIHPLVFRNLTRLEYLDLGFNRIKDLCSGMLKGLSNLRTFNITVNQELSEISSGFFKKLHNLTEINAQYCSISSLEKDVFSDLINLKTVNLAFNRIEHLPPNLLKNNKLLTKFSCSFNKISALPTGIFHGLSELREFEFRGNRLENLPVNIFQNLSSLRHLDLSKNRLTFLHENVFLPLNRLTHLDLSNNNLTKLTGKRPFGSSRHLNYVNLNKAGLTQWPVFNWTEHDLTVVDFSNNYFETVKLPIYTPNRVIMRLYNCKIRTIYIVEWKYGFEMPTYDLCNNQITCDDKLQQFVSFVKSNTEVAKEMFPNIENTKCFGEERNLLDNTSFVVIGNYCPMNCECFSKHNHEIINCSRKKIDRIPDFLVPNATIVDLSNNYIKDFSNVDCVTWRNVTHLRLSNNSLSNISDYVLLPNLKYLWLDGNRLTQLPSGLMNLVDVLTEFKIFLSRNNWNCDCHSQFTKDWLLRNRQKIADFSDVYCGRNSSSVSFIDIVSNDGCREIPEINLASSVNASSSNEDNSDEVSSVFGWKIAVALLTSIMLFSWIVFARFVYCQKKRKCRQSAKV
ncbi:slit homolog 3 protein-like [Centruroides vittatus]|uniref:slit homolog 3 protein-like n=1 Tax=Centruroides vittatus TaxID=120091 RepID=UPI00350F1635